MILLEGSKMDFSAQASTLRRGKLDIFVEKTAKMARILEESPIRNDTSQKSVKKCHFLTPPDDRNVSFSANLVNLLN